MPIITGDTDMLMDGVAVPLPTPEETPAFDAWIKANKVNNPFNPAQHYDSVSAFRKGINRSPEGHFPDTFKTPGHPTFSIESMYYKPNLPAGYWDEQGQYHKIFSPLQVPSDVWKRIGGDK